MSENKSHIDTKKNNIVTPSEKLMCGLVMPISSGNGYTADHWIEVRAIIDECISLAGFKSRMVSEANESGLIHNRIVENLYSDPLIVCDVSSKNANVMFELGMRLSFDKPVIILKDDETDYSFDTGIIEHIPYPRNLRYASINLFKIRLIDKIRATYEMSLSTGYSAFLKNFKNVTANKLEGEELTSTQLILREIQELRKDTAMSTLPRTNKVMTTMSEDTLNNDLEETVLAEVLILIYTSQLPGSYEKLRELGGDLLRTTVAKNIFKLYRDKYRLVSGKVLDNAVAKISLSLKASESIDAAIAHLMGF
jgi:hypothetical protein